MTTLSVDIQVTTISVKNTLGFNTQVRTPTSNIQVSTFNVQTSAECFGALLLRSLIFGQNVQGVGG